MARPYGRADRRPTASDRLRTRQLTYSAGGSTQGTLVEDAELPPTGIDPLQLPHRLERPADGLERRADPPRELLLGERERDADGVALRLTEALAQLEQPRGDPADGADHGKLDELHV